MTKVPFFFPQLKLWAKLKNYSGNFGTKVRRGMCFSPSVKTDGNS